MKENIFRTHNCNEISLDDVGKKVRISGFVQTIRWFWRSCFLDIRDMYGVTQVVTSADSSDVDFASHIPMNLLFVFLVLLKKEILKQLTRN